MSAKKSASLAQDIPSTALSEPVASAMADEAPAAEDRPRPKVGRIPLNLRLHADSDAAILGDAGWADPSLQARRGDTQFMLLLVALFVIVNLALVALIHHKDSSKAPQVATPQQPAATSPVVAAPVQRAAPQAAAPMPVPPAPAAQPQQQAAPVQPQPVPAPVAQQQPVTLPTPVPLAPVTNAYVPPPLPAPVPRAPAPGAVKATAAPVTQVTQQQMPVLAPAAGAAPQPQPALQQPAGPVLPPATSLPAPAGSSDLLSVISEN